MWVKGRPGCPLLEHSCDLHWFLLLFFYCSWQRDEYVTGTNTGRFNQAKRP